MFSVRVDFLFVGGRSIFHRRLGNAFCRLIGLEQLGRIGVRSHFDSGLIVSRRVTRGLALNRVLASIQRRIGYNVAATGFARGLILGGKRFGVVSPDSRLEK